MFVCDCLAWLKCEDQSGNNFFVGCMHDVDEMLGLWLMIDSDIWWHQSCVGIEGIIDYHRHHSQLSSLCRFCKWCLPYVGSKNGVFSCMLSCWYRLRAFCNGLVHGFY